MFANLFSGIANAFRRSLLLRALLVIVVLCAGALTVDHFINGSKIYKGVHVGDIDLSGMTTEEASSAIEARYAEPLATTRILVFRDEEYAGMEGVDEQIAQQAALAEQMSVEEARESTVVWWTNAELLNANLPSQLLAEEAYAVGRDDGGVLRRVRAMVTSWDIPIRAEYSEELVEDFAHEIDMTVGEPRQDFNISIADGAASVTSGTDGYIIDRAWLYDKLNESFFSGMSSDASFVAETTYAPIRISYEQAYAACEYVNQILAHSVSFSYASHVWNVDEGDLASWITTSVDQQGRGYVLNVLLDESLVKPDVLAHVNEITSGRDVTIDIEEQDGDYLIHTDGSVEVPQLQDAVSLLDSTLFGSYRKDIGLVDDDKSNGDIGIADVSDSGILVEIQKGFAPSIMPFDEALQVGLITDVSSYTTEYVSSTATANRRHNIHHAADIISGSIVESNGGTWSFNERVGECTEETGFLGAGAIIGGEYDDAVGGGICQVATTVFNSVYEGGYPVVRRYNHSLYIASYPTGRDAAIAYPDLDLIWRNDSTSDVLMLCSYTDSTLTVSLYSVDQGYEVSSDVGEWSEGKKYTTKNVIDEDARPGSSYVETAGRDGRKITVYRTVRDAEGNIIIEDAFTSNYDPVTEVVVKGPEIKSESSSEGSS